jgi:hypothetical protein
LGVISTCPINYKDCSERKEADYFFPELVILGVLYKKEIIINKKCWEEPTGSFPLIRLGPHRKRLFRQFFIAAVTSLPSSDLPTIKGCTYRPTDSPLGKYGLHRQLRIQQFFYCYVYSLQRKRVYRTVA